jgi:hypothetical protein
MEEETVPYENPWIYEGKIFESEGFEDYTGFVYLITNITNGRKYIGQKKLWGTKSLVKKFKNGKKGKRKVRIDSDWRSYYGSNSELKEDVKSLGIVNFKREIIKLCKTKGMMNYEEMREQILRDVLLDDNFYNAYVGGRVSRVHVKKDP